MKFCTKCGTANNDDSVFCLKCGNTFQEARQEQQVPQVQQVPQEQPQNQYAYIGSQQPIKPKKKGKGCLLVVLIFIIISAIGIAATIGLGDATQKQLSGVSDTSEYITLEEYNQIKSGMTYDEVKEIIGSDGTLSATSSVGGYTVTIYVWYGNGIAGSNANITFTNGEVTGKAQVGLQ